MHGRGRHTTAATHHRENLKVDENDKPKDETGHGQGKEQKQRREDRERSDAQRLKHH